MPLYTVKGYIFSTGENAFVSELPDWALFILITTKGIASNFRKNNIQVLLRDLNVVFTMPNQKESQVSV